MLQSTAVHPWPSCSRSQTDVSTRKIEPGAALDQTRTLAADSWMDSIERQLRVRCRNFTQRVAWLFELKQEREHHGRKDEYLSTSRTVLARAERGKACRPWCRKAIALARRSIINSFHHVLIIMEMEERQVDQQVRQLPRPAHQNSFSIQPITLNSDCNKSVDQILDELLVVSKTEEHPWAQPMPVPSQHVLSRRKKIFQQIEAEIEARSKERLSIYEECINEESEFEDMCPRAPEPSRHRLSVISEVYYVDSSGSRRKQWYDKKVPLTHYGGRPTNLTIGWRLDRISAKPQQARTDKEKARKGHDLLSKEDRTNSIYQVVHMSTTDNTDQNELLRRKPRLKEGLHEFARPRPLKYVAVNERGFRVSLSNSRESNIWLQNEMGRVMVRRRGRGLNWRELQQGMNLARAWMKRGVQVDVNKLVACLCTRQ